MTKAFESVIGLIVAGGLARRMGGGDKSLLSLGDKTLLQRTIDNAQPQVATLLINANGNTERFSQFHLPIIADKFPNNLGPLAGIHSGLAWMKTNSAKSWLASFAPDTPFFPVDLVEKLFQQITQSTTIVVAQSAQKTHSIFALWHVSLLEKIEVQLKTGNIPRTQDWIKQQNTLYVTFPIQSYDPFFNINTPEDFVAAEAILALAK